MNANNEAEERSLLPAVPGPCCRAGAEGDVGMWAWQRCQQGPPRVPASAFFAVAPQEAASPPFGTAGKLKVVIFVSADCGEGRAAGWEQLLHGTSKRWKCKTWLFFFFLSISV